MEERKKRDTKIDCIRLLSAIGVMGLHILKPESGGAAALFYGLSGLSVPVFFMCSGFFWMERDIRVLTHLKKIGKLLGLILCCTLVYGTAVWLVNYVGAGEGSFTDLFWVILGEAGLSLIRDGHMFHLWFCWALCALELLMPPILSLIRFKATKKQAVMRTKLVFLALFFLGALRQWISFFLGFPLIRMVPLSGNILTWLMAALFGALIGEAYRKQRLPGKPLIPAVLFLSCFISGYFFWGRTGFDPVIDSYYGSPGLTLACGFLVILALSVLPEKEGALSFVNTQWIYLWHVLFLFLWEEALHQKIKNQVLFWLLFSGVMVGLSIVIGLLKKKMKSFRNKKANEKA